MSTNYPASSLDSYTTLVDNTDSVLAAHMNDRGDAIEALEAKVGIDGSVVATSIDYFLKHASGAYRNHKHDGTSDDGVATIGPLTGLTIANNVDMGNFQIRALQFYADVVTGTAPFLIDSTTLVTNLNADLLDGIEASGFIQTASGTQSIDGTKSFSALKISGSMDCNNQQMLSMRIENRTSDPGSPTVGQMWFRTDI
jgi:hypothetical protein